MDQNIKPDKDDSEYQQKKLEKERKKREKYLKKQQGQQKLLAQGKLDNSKIERKKGKVNKNKQENTDENIEINNESYNNKDQESKIPNKFVPNTLKEANEDVELVHQQENELVKQLNKNKDHNPTPIIKNANSKNKKHIKFAEKNDEITLSEIDEKLKKHKYKSYEYIKPREPKTIKSSYKLIKSQYFGNYNYIHRNYFDKFRLTAYNEVQSIYTAFLLKNNFIGFSEYYIEGIYNIIISALKESANLKEFSKFLQGSQYLEILKTDNLVKRSVTNINKEIIDYIEQVKGANKPYDKVMEFVKVRKQVKTDIHMFDYNEYLYNILKQGHKHILVYSFDPYILNTLDKLKDTVDLTLLLVDNPPENSLKPLIPLFENSRIQVKYFTYNASSYAVKQCDFILLGAYSIKLNGTIQSKTGTGIIAKLAKHYKKPVYVLADTSKFDDRALLETYSKNEVREAKGPDDYNNLHNNRSFFNCKRFNLSESRTFSDSDGSNNEITIVSYDLLHCKYVSFLLTEVGIFPVSSIPMIQKKIHDENNYNVRKASSE